MLESSFIYLVFVNFIDKLKFNYERSLLKKILDKLVFAINNIWNYSLIRKILLYDFNSENYYKKSIASFALNKISLLANFTSSKLYLVIVNSYIIRCIKSFIDSLLHINIGDYALVLFIVALLNAIGRVVRFQLFDATLFFEIICAAVFGLLIMVKLSFAQIYNKSFLLGVCAGFFGLEAIKEKTLNKINIISLVFIGIILAVICFFVGWLYFLLGIIGGVGALLVLYKTEIGVYATVFLIPILPTKFILALSLFTSISFIINSFITGNIKIKFNFIDLFVVLFSLVLVYSVPIAYFSKSGAIVAATYLLFIFFYFVVKNTINTKEKLYSLISIIVVAGGLVSLFGIFQYITGSYLATDAWIDVEMFTDTKARIYSTLENPNVLGEYLLFIIPLSFAMLYYFENYFYKFIAAAMLSFSGLCIVLTYSRGAWLGLIFGIFIFVMIKDRRLMWLGIIAIILSPLVIPTSIIERFTSIGNLSDGSTSYRVNIYLASLLMLKAFWPIGIGLGYDNFVYVYRKYAFNAINAPHSHNLYLQIMIDLGIVGFIIFICFMALYFKNLLLVDSKSNDKFLTSISAALCAGMGGFMLQAMTDNVWYNYRVVLFFWVIMAFSSIAYSLSSNKTLSMKANEFKEVIK